MEKERLHPSAIKSWMIARIITAIFIIGPMMFVRFIILKDEFQSGEIIFRIVNIGMIVLAIFMILNMIVYPFYEYKQWRYIITKDKIEYSHGIFNIKKVIIPIVRIQHIQVSQGVINRMFNLADIVITTAAAGNQKIPNIEMSRAEEISDYLNGKVKEKVEEKVENNV